ncbi:MAG: 4a-hydroxytetrahydrobiopterin dehydratase [Candidatus Krumholzibacteria bacterium]|jgi:4a-hydroxytetrahydrobiopterin dehydratase|nr:4a-hydroxytetrahydrobiopterin dehydratase [Candidatus Krumholzibacteria bacterium]
MTDLAGKRCIPCSGSTPPLTRPQIKALLDQVPEWEAILDHHLRRVFHVPDFQSALQFVNRIGALAEAEAHHPSISFTWGRVEVEIWTHKIDGLSEADFVLAAKIDALPRG